MRLCTVPGCASKHLAKGLCRRHYLRVYKRGTLELSVLRGAPIVDRILAKVTQASDGCWIFEGCLTERGYGHIRDGRKMRMAHRVMFEAVRGPLPEGHEIDHLCRRRACVNLDHLEGRYPPAERAARQCRARLARARTQRAGAVHTARGLI